jgi:hypothetical protein
MSEVTRTIDEHDLRIDVDRNEVGAHVRIIHLPTGLRWQADGRNALEAKAAALKELTDRMSKPRDQTPEEPDAPTGTQSRTIGWTGSRLTVRELRGWLNPLPDNAYIEVWYGKVRDEEEMRIFANWEVP